MGLWSSDVARATQGDSAAQDLTELSLEQLARTKVVSLARKPEEWWRTAAAVYVITHEDIRRSGARTIPELLRFVPGVDVARITSSRWAIGIRGFTSSLARAQLVMIDGRSVYNPLFAGTYWDVQNLPLKEIERIEVIRGPGGTLWGANAVTGVINIITKSATETQGGRLTAGAGDQERGFGAVSYGGAIGASGHYRAYARYFDRGPEHDDQTGDFDGWHMAQTGFRSDWTRGTSDTLTVQGDVYRGRAGQRTTIALYEPPFSRTVEQEAKLSGGNLRARWTRGFADGSELSLQTYYDGNRREEANFREDRDTLDFDGQYRLSVARRHELVAGAGYRLSNGRTAGAPVVRFDPPDRTDDVFTAFAEDTVELVSDRLSLSAGVKVERNDYTGFEFQPSARLGWATGQRHYVWMSVTRAVRTPSRIERDLTLDASVSAVAPVFIRLVGDAGFHSESVLALEGGYRGRPSERAMVSVAVFRHRHHDLTSLEPGPPFVESGRLFAPFRWANGLEGTVSGLEVASQLQPLAPWFLRVGYSYLNMQLEAKPASLDTLSEASEDASPTHSLFLWTSHDLPHDLLLDASLRWVGRRPSQRVDSYAELDLRLAWQRSDRLELAGIGRNLLAPRHAEFGGVTQIERSLFVEATWRW